MLIPDDSLLKKKNADHPLSIIAAQLRRLFVEPNQEAHLEAFESLIVHQAFSYAESNQVRCAALLGISRNVMRRLLKRHGLLIERHYSKSHKFDHYFEVSHHAAKNRAN